TARSLNSPARLAAAARTLAAPPTNGRRPSAVEGGLAIPEVKGGGGRPARPVKELPGPGSDRPPPSPGAVRQWAQWSVGEAFLELGSGPAGLSARVSTRRRARDGANRLPELDRRSAAQILSDHLVSVPTLMLVAATGLSLATGGLADAVV